MWKNNQGIKIRLKFKTKFLSLAEMDKPEVGKNKKEYVNSFTPHITNTTSEFEHIYIGFQDFNRILCMHFPLFVSLKT